MIKDITIGQYIPGDTIIHNLDPRIKIIITFVFITLLFFVGNYFSYLYIIAFMGLAIVLSKISPTIIKG